MVATKNYSEQVSRLENTVTEETMYRPRLFFCFPILSKDAFDANTDCLFFPRWLKIATVSVLTLFVVACAHDPLPFSDFAKKTTPPKTAKTSLQTLPPKTAMSAKTSLQTPPPQTQKNLPASWHLFKVSSQQTLENLFKRQQFNETQLKALLKLEKFSRQLQQFRSTHELRVKYRPNGYVEAVTLVLEGQKALYITHGENGFIEHVGLDVGQTVIHSAKGSIYSSLFAEDNSHAETALSEKMLTDLIDIFRWDENFILNIQLDDRFTVLYETELSQTQEEETILAAEFFTQGKVYRAVRYKDEQGHAGYYTPNGNSLYPLETDNKIASFQIPVSFKKITSKFGIRKHPILRRWLFHKGVDYAASSGTPIVAAANATVEFVGRKRGYGKVVVLKHDDHYETLYAHMSRFSQGIKEGNRVEQGTVIGYVGQTGFATGAHLHFEVRVDGVNQDPLLAQALPSKNAIVAKVDKTKFFKQTKNILAQLDDAISSQPMPIKTLPVLAKSKQVEYVSKQADELIKTAQNASSPNKSDHWLFWSGYGNSIRLPIDH